MPTVDDLVVSLRIEDTGNLGKLQKQLSALVGEKGEKKMDLGDISPGIKRELAQIRNELSFISTQTVPEVGNVRDLRESLHRDRKTLERTFDLANKRLVSQNTRAFQEQLEEYGVKDEPELLLKLGDTLKNFIGMMKLGEMGKLPGEIMQKVDFAAKMLISSEKLSKGGRKTLIDKMENAIGELNTMFSKVLTQAGIIHKPEFNLYQIRESWYRKMGLSKTGIQFDMKELFETNEDVRTAFDKIKEFVAHKGGVTEFMTNAMKTLGITPTPETFTVEAIKKSPELTAIAEGILKKAWGTKAGIPSGFHEYLLKRISDVSATTSKEMYEKGRPDFLLLGNKLEDLEKIFPPEVAKTLSQLISYIELKSILTESNKEQFKKYSDMVGKGFLVGIAALVKSSFKDYFPDIETAQLNIVSLLEKFDPFMTLEQLKELSKQRMEQKILENTDKELCKEIEGIEKESTGKIAEQGALSEDKMKDVLSSLDDIKATTDDTNKKVNDEDLNNKNTPPVVKED